MKKGNGGANHQYVVCRVEGSDATCNNVLNEWKAMGDRVVAAIQFQDGARNNPESISGVLDVDLLEIVRDRLTSFQEGEFSCFENLKALEHIESALHYLNKRVEDRLERNVLGQNIK